MHCKHTTGIKILCHNINCFLPIVLLKATSLLLNRQFTRIIIIYPCVQLSVTRFTRLLCHVSADLYKSCFEKF